MTLVAGVDTSTQSCKVVVRDAATGVIVRQGRAAHPDGTEVHPDRWWDAFVAAVADAGGLDDVAAISVGGQQHGMVALDSTGRVVRDALLWNDTRSAPDAEDLIVERGNGDRDRGAAWWAEQIGTVPVPSLTVTKLRWLARSEPENAAKVAAVALPHDWLSWRMAGNDPTGSGADIGQLVTDRSDASGTGYWADAAPLPEGHANQDRYRRDILESALGRSDIFLPTVLPGHGQLGRTKGVPGVPDGLPIGAGAGDNAAAGLGVGAGVGDVVISIGTSGTVFAVSATPTHDASGIVAGFASADDAYLPLVCTLNAARVLDATAAMLGIDHAELARLALSAPMGAEGLVLVPYLEGERTPNRPTATGALHGLRLATMNPAHLARAAVEGLLCGLADGLDALIDQGVAVERILLVGGAAQSPAVAEIAPAIFGRPTGVPAPDEYVAAGAARQAAWMISGEPSPPRWSASGVALREAEAAGFVREQYADVSTMTANRP